MLNKTKSGFTLSEVLITLAIIGIVAALTVPSLITRYQKQTWIDHYLKTYKLMSDATKMVMRANEDTLQGAWNGVADNVGMFNAYAPYLQIGKNCIGQDPQGSCFASVYTRLMGGDADAVGANCSIQLVDGTSLAFVAYNTTYGIIYIDTNGKDKGPNVLGKDYHRFNVYLATGEVKPSFWDMDTATINARCPDTLTGHVGDTCGARILRGNYGLSY